VEAETMKNEELRVINKNGIKKTPSAIPEGVFY
jgi:hypothetical protein